ncbi:MAG: rhodanese-like domain-containing protein [Bacteroidota bacterium]
MKNSLLILLFLFSLISCSEAQQTKSNVEVVDAETFHQKIENESEIQLIDVRTPQEFESGVIHTSAKLIDFNASDFAQQLEELDKDKPVLVYCAVGGRSQQAAKMLDKMGYKEIYDLKGGIQSYQKQYSIEKQ